MVLIIRAYERKISYPSLSLSLSLSFSFSFVYATNVKQEDLKKPLSFHD
jgi:hypothetical protein